MARTVPLEHDLDLGTFAPLVPEQIFYLLAFEKEGRGVAKSSAPGDAARWLEELRFYIASHVPSVPAPEVTDLRRIVRRAATIGWKPAQKYSLWAQLFPDSWWTFMNLGLDDVDLGTPRSLIGAERFWKSAVRMYEKLARMVDLRKKDVLEVGSGRGGGARYLARRSVPRVYTGVDATRSNVIFSRATHRRRNLRFVHGYAENLPLDNNSVDVVINVESCTYYRPLHRFVAEVRRVLRPGGRLLTTFYDDASKVLGMHDAFIRGGLRLTYAEDVSSSVRSAIAGGEGYAVVRRNKTVREKRLYMDMMRFFFDVPALVSGESSYVFLIFERR